MFNLNSEAVRGGTVCLSKAGLKIGNSDAKDVDIAAPNGAGVDFAINGILYHKADAADIALTAADAQAADTSCIYLICLNSSGTLSSVKGTEVTTADITSGKTPLTFPAPTENTCPIGYVRVDTDSVTFTAGTTELSASGVTDTYVDLFSVPTTPLTS
uniref:Uncharacterized protein n=1 Tax=viral metagenome TaxID=1070528 RepID=A0A6M3K2Z8_9ZZZZ